MKQYGMGETCSTHSKVITLIQKLSREYLTERENLEDLDVGGRIKLK